MKTRNASHLTPVGPSQSSHGAGALASGSFADRDVRAIDIWDVARRAPEQWARFMRETYRGDLVLIQITFQVTERTARRWLAGEGGVRGQHHVVAQLEYPEEYRRIVLARAA